MASILNATTSSGLVTSADNSGSLQLATNNGTTAVTIDTSQNVGIGTSSPTQKLEVTTTTRPQLKVSYNGTSGIFLSDATTSAYKSWQISSSDITGNTLQFTPSTANNGTTFTTPTVTFTSSGNLLVGTTSAISSGFTTISYNGTALNGLIISESAGISDTSFIGFNSGATNIGSVSRVGLTNAVVYSTTSDQRLKSNIADANPVLDKLMDVKVRQFDWTEGNLHQDAGFIAQELAPVLSGIVTQGKTEEDMWQLDYSRLTPYLVKAIQELKTELDATKAEVQALKGVA